MTEGKSQPDRPRVRKLTHAVTIRLDPPTLERLREKAHQQGIGPTTLVRMWILEELKKRKGANGSSQPMV